MHKILILQAFDKARNERTKIGDNKPSLRNLSKDISDFIDETEGFTLCWKSYYNYYKSAKKTLNTDNDIGIKQLTILNGLLNYAGYNSYKDFLDEIGRKNMNHFNHDSRVKSIKKKKVFFGDSIPNKNLFYHRVGKKEKAIGIKLKLRIM